MKTNIKIVTFSIVLLAMSISSCKKYLDKKPQQTLTVPSTLNDLQAVLDNDSYMNQATCALPELVADNYYVTTASWQSSTFDEQLNYIWDPTATEINSWQNSYQGPIYFSNVVLNVLPTIAVDLPNGALWNSIKGSALFYRAFAFHQLAQVYCRPYSSSAGTDLGIVLKLTGDIKAALARSTVQQTYDQIINDLKAAANLLPITTAVPTRPNKAAAYGALARAYLNMRDYVNAGKYADSCLQQKNSLMDYNTAAVPFPQFNIEILYQSLPLLNLDLLFDPPAIIDSNLYRSYNSNDLRKTVFFSPYGDGTYGFNGSYAGYFGVGFVPFDGIATDEMYLIRAECYARAGNKDAALADLNTLMVKRWKNNGSWVPFTATDATDALNKILIERRKELIYRELRWSDIRRLNLEGANITLTRIVNGLTYTLPSNDLRTVMLIPQQEINLSGIPQNPR